jgi:hypothetical protein
MNFRDLRPIRRTKIAKDEAESGHFQLNLIWTSGFHTARVNRVALTASAIWQVSMQYRTCLPQLMALPRSNSPGGYVVLIFLADDHAAFFFGAGRAVLACSSIESTSPARTAPINTSMTAGSLTIEPAMTPALTFSNSIGFQPRRAKNTTSAFSSVRHHGSLMMPPSSAT